MPLVYKITMVLVANFLIQPSFEKSMDILTLFASA